MKKMIERINGKDRSFLTYVGERNPHSVGMIAAELEKDQILHIMERLEEYESSGLSSEKVLEMKKLMEEDYVLVKEENWWLKRKSEKVKTK